MTGRRFWMALCCAAACAAQAAPDNNLRFDVAALKPSLPNQAGGILRPTVGNQGYHAVNLPLRAYVMVAFGLRDTQISGAPGWLAADPYDLEAKAEKPSSNDELHVMLQNLLVDRCHLKYHMETKEQSGFALVLDKEGMKMTEHDAADKDYPPIRPAGPGKVEGTNVAMNYVALFLSRIVDRPVVDKTGLTAHYDFKLEFAPERPAGADGGNPAPIDAPPLMEALKTQLGLRLEQAKAPTQHLVIDHIEKPGDN